MTRADRLWPVAVLIVLGAGWGVTLPLTKIAVSSGHGHYGLIFWQLVIGAVLMAALCTWRGLGLPGHAGAWRSYAVIALVGTVIPNTASYQAIVHLPSGVASILLSLIPMFAFPIALALRLERFRARRLAGLLAGLGGVLLLIGPEASLPDRSMLIWVLVELIAVLCYAGEGNYVARVGLAGLHPMQVMWGASMLGAGVALPLALGSGQFISPLRVWAAPEWAFTAASVIHVLVYAGYVWLVGRAGSVFAVQVSYLVTGFGVLGAIVLLGESYSPYIWAALALVMAGVFLVQPRPKDALASGAAIGETEP